MERKKNIAGKGRSSPGRGVARGLALQILCRVEREGAYADLLLDKSLSRYAPNKPDRGLLTELVYGVLRWQARLDYYLDQVLEQPISKADATTRMILRLGAYQILNLDRIPRAAAVDESVKLSSEKYRGLVNAVLRKLGQRIDGKENEPLRQPDDIKEPVQRIAVSQSHPVWLVESWIKRWGADECEALCQADNLRAGLTLRVNTTRTSRAGLISYLKNQEIEAAAGAFSPWAVRIESRAAVRDLPGFRKGLFAVQDEASQMVVLLLDPRPGEKILDACAAPGTKSLAIAQASQGQAQVLAVDCHGGRLKLMRDEALRLGLGGVKTLEADARLPLPLPGSAKFDRILVDAPCSGLGTLRHHPDKKWRITPEDIEKLTQLQKEILKTVASYLKPGGILVYSTCTYPAQENEEVISTLLNSGEFEMEDAASYLPETAITMVQDKVLRAFPHRHGTDGFTAFRLVRSKA